MNNTQGQHVVVASLFAAGAIDAVAEIGSGHAPSLKTSLALIVVGVLLTALADGAPQLAAGFAVTVLVSSLFTSGITALADIKGALS